MLDNCYIIVFNIALQRFKFDKKNKINKIPSLGTDVIVRVESIEAIANCLYGDDLKETVIQKMAAELFQVRGSSFKILEDFPFHSFRSIFSSIEI